MNFFKISKVFLWLTPLMIFVVSASTLFPFIVAKYIWFRTAVDLAMIFFVLGLLFQDRASAVFNSFVSIFKKPLVLAVCAFVLMFLLACLFGFDPARSFWSNFERGEGGFQLLHLLAFFILSIALLKEEKDWQMLFVFTFIGALGMVLYGVLAGFDVKAFIGPRFNDPGFRFQGSIGNSAYVAAYAIFMMFYAVYLLVSKYKNKLLSFGAIILWFLLALFLAVFFGAATRGAFIGLIGSIVVFLSYFAFCSKRWRKWFIAGGVVVIILVALMIQFKNDSAFIKALPISRILDISFSAKTFEDRAIMWKTAIDGWKARPIFGWGPENFLQVFDRYFNIKYFKPAEGFGAWFDRAHSVYFDYLAETGILGLLSFLGVWIVFYWQRVKFYFKFQKQDKPPLIVNGLILALPAAYLVQGIVLFDVLPIYLNVFMFLAFAVYHFNKQKTAV